MAGRRLEQRHPGYAAGARAVLPLAIAIGLLGVVFGYQATAAGLSRFAAIAMSATTFAGSAQFAAITVLAAGGSVLAAVGAAALLNARYLAMGATVAIAMKGGGIRRMLLGQLVVDESWAVAHQRNGSFDLERLIGAGLLLYVIHVGSTAVGAFAGATLGSPGRWGLDAAFPALFLVLLWPRLDRSRERKVAALGAGLAILLTPFTPPGIPLLAAGLSSLLAGREP